MKYVLYLLSSILLLTATVFPQTQNSPFETIQKGSKTLVKIPVVVSDREGRRISGLKKEDFSIFKGGVKQNIASFDTEQEPVSVALLLDTSGSTQEVLDKIKDAAKDFIESLKPDDKCLIATFDSRLNFLISFTSDKHNLKDSLDRIQTAERDGTIMFSAIDQITQNSFARVKGRKAIVILSDGKDYGSTITKNDLLSELNESDVSIYPIYYQSGTGFTKLVVADNGAVVEGAKKIKPKKETKPKKRKNVYTVLIPLPADAYTPEEIKLIDKVATTDAVSTLKEMSDLTAGRFYLSDSAKLNSIFKQVAAELKQQYSLGFYADGAVNNNFMRDVRVKVDRPDAVVQTHIKLSIKNQ
ncbi:MAG: VWA domain-containing protein [Pyrinomonadaceae bacterium]